MENSFKLQGKLVSRDAVVSKEAKNGKTYKSRRFVIGWEDEYNDKKYEKCGVFALKHNNVDVVSDFKKDDMLEVTFNVDGRSYVKGDETKYFSENVAYKVEKIIQEKAVETEHKKDLPF